MAKGIFTNLPTYLKQKRELINSALKKYISSCPRQPRSLYNAMHYSVFPSGKSFRPILTLLATELCGGDIKKALPAACAIELIHNFSLIQDNLPSMDNDDYTISLRSIISFSHVYSLAADLIDENPELFPDYYRYKTPDLSCSPCPALFLRGLKITPEITRDAIRQDFKARLKQLSVQPLLDSCQTCQFFTNYKYHLENDTLDLAKNTVCQSGCFQYQV
jgi:hypothetical protein